jgi:hypothetical protein
MAALKGLSTQKDKGFMAALKRCATLNPSTQNQIRMD